MKANRRAREEAVSSVLGGILFFALIFLVLSVVRFEFVPIWEEDKEAAHMGTVQSQFANLKSEIDRQTGNRTSVPVTHPMALGFTSTSRFFTPSSLPGSLTFTSGTSQSVLSAPEILVLTQDGRSTAAIDEDWISITGPTTLDSVAEIQHLRIRVLDPWDESHGDSITLTVTDAAGQFAGSLTVYIHRDPPEKFINSRVIGPAGQVIYDQGEAFHQISTIGYWWISALDPAMHFADVLNAARAPFTVTLTESGMHGEYTITYLESAGTGSVLVGSSGVTVPDYNATLGGGALLLDSSNSFFVDQDYYLENGAVILVQDGKAAMRIPPDLTIGAGSTLSRVGLTVPALTGDSNSISQRGTASLSTQTRSNTQIQGTAPSFTHTVSTQFPQVWSAFFIRAAQDGGLSAAAGEFAVTSTADSATITICGASRDCDVLPPTSTDHDLSLRLSYATLRVSLHT